MRGFSERLEVLRRIDSLIDFSRATAQLRILVALNTAVLSIDEIVERTSLRRKTVLDALRKLELKGLVERVDGRYRLSRRGRAVYDALRSILTGDVVGAPHVPSVKPVLYDSYEELLSVVYMLRALKVIGRRRRPYPLSKLARKLGVSAEALDSHLKRFTTPRLPILRRIAAERGVVYTATELGQRLYRMLYAKTPRSVLAKLLHRIAKGIRFLVARVTGY